MPTNESSFEAYLQLDSIQGEAVESGHEHWIKMLGFQHNLKQDVTGTISGAGQRVVGKSVHDSFSFLKRIDKSSPYFNRELCSGKNIPKATIEVINSEDKKNVLLKITLEKVVIKSVTVVGGTSPTSLTGGIGNGTGLSALIPLELVELDYSKISWEYHQYQNSQKVATTRAEHDISKNVTS